MPPREAAFTLPSVLSPFSVALTLQVPVRGRFVVKLPAVLAVPVIVLVPSVMVIALPAATFTVSLGRVAPSTVSSASCTLLASMPDVELS